ncbi:hypothetical protein KW801_03410 [Candidatus Saccharibacteria bacterium]|nr:hypothetical protein [Candidatus Saccharibacteria bacterium]
MPNLAEILKHNIIVFLGVVGVVAAVLLSGLVDTVNQNSSAAVGTNYHTTGQLKEAGITVGGAAGAVGSFSTSYGQTVGGSAQGPATSVIQGSVPPSSGSTYVPPAASQPSQDPSVAPEQDILYPIDPPPYKCMYFMGNTNSCSYCVDNNIACGGCGGYRGVEIMCATL